MAYHSTIGLDTINYASIDITGTIKDFVITSIFKQGVRSRPAFSVRYFMNHAQIINIHLAHLLSHPLGN